MADTSATSTAGAAGASTVPPSADNSSETVDVASSEQTSQSDPLALDKPKQTKKVAAPVEDDDPEVDFFGEKLKKSEIERLRKVDKSAKEIERESHKRFQEAAKQAKELAAREQRMQEALRNGKDNFWALAEEMGLNADELAEQRLAQAVKRAQMTPEQLEQEKAMAELEELRRFKAETEQLTVKQQHEQTVERLKQQIDNDVGAAFMEVGLPKSHKNMVNLLDTLTSFHEAGQPIDAKTAAKIVKQDLLTDTRSLFGELFKSNPTEAIAMLGPEIIEAVSKARVATVQAQKSQPQPRVSQPQPQKETLPPTIEEVRRQLGIKVY